MGARILNRLLEAADKTDSRRWQRRKRQKVAALERRLSADYSAVFQEQQRLFMRRFGELKPLFPRIYEAHLAEVSPLDVAVLLAGIHEETRQAAIAAIQQAVEAALLAGGESLLVALGDAAADVAFDLAFPAAVEFLAQYGAAQVAKIEETTRREIQRIVTQAAQEGWSWQRTANTIIDKYESFASPMLRGGPGWFENRAQLIAVTEIGNAYETGSNMAARQLQAMGLEMEKAWSGPNDRLTSVSCLINMEAGWIPIDDVFPSGHDKPLSHPGCRHTALYRSRRKI